MSNNFFCRIRSIPANTGLFAKRDLRPGTKILSEECLLVLYNPMGRDYAQRPPPEIRRKRLVELNEQTNEAEKQLDRNEDQLLELRDLYIEMKNLMKQEEWREKEWAQVHADLGEVYHRQDNLKLAKALLECAVKISDAGYGEDSALTDSCERILETVKRKLAGLPTGDTPPPSPLRKDFSKSGRRRNRQ